MTMVYFESMTPSQEEAQTIVESVLHKKVVQLTRFLTGLDNYVYKVQLEDESYCVIRLNVQGKESQYISALYWYEKLEPAHIPLPKLIASNTTPGTLPFMIMEYIPGADLGEVYTHLSISERKSIAYQLASIHESVAKELPLGPGFGFTESYESQNVFPTWTAVLQSHLDRSRDWITEVGLVDARLVEVVRAKLPHYEDYFSHIKPTPFLHDTTTKNVLVSEGKIIGIVDIDSICFGDPLFVLALTKMSLLSMEESTNYSEFWSEALHLTPLQNKIVDLYTTLFCLNFLGEIGKQFNKPLEVAVHSPQNFKEKEKLEDILTNLLKGI